MYEKLKIYHDGSHYVANMPTYPCRPSKYRGIPYPVPGFFEIQEDGNLLLRSILPQFESCYRASLLLPSAERRSFLEDNLCSHVPDQEVLSSFLDEYTARRRRNTALRKLRLSRKVSLTPFNYFCTFSYSDDRMDEDVFRRKLRRTISHFSERRGWKYIGVWERGANTGRLHFHGIFYIPEGQMVGELVEEVDFSVRKRRLQVSVQNTFFNKKFGRSDFKKLESAYDLRETLSYLMKYLEKSGERLCFSKGLPEFFYSDVREEDIVCPMGIDGRKSLLFDDFSCSLNGEVYGAASYDVIKRLALLST